MPDLTLPEIHLPDVKLPDGLRDMNRHDIQGAIGERMPKRIELPDIDLSKVEMPKSVETGLGRVGKAVDRIDLPKAVDDRLPRRRRTNPILPIAALVVIGSIFAATWWFLTSPTATTRVRETADRLRMKLSGRETTVQRYDDDRDLGSLVPDPDQTRPSVEAETWPDTFSD